MGTDRLQSLAFGSPHIGVEGHNALHETQDLGLFYAESAVLHTASRDWLALRRDDKTGN